MTRNIYDWSREATTRFLTDPDFHARVLVAVKLTETVALSGGVVLPPEAQSGLVQACTFGLLMVDYNPADFITAEEAVASMKSMAEALGMQVKANPLTGEVIDVDFQSG